jgi:hypothetical protein
MTSISPSPAPLSSPLPDARTLKLDYPNMKAWPEEFSRRLPLLSPQEINVFALLRELTALLQKLFNITTQQKITQSLYQLQLNLMAAANIRNTGSKRWYLGWAKAVSMGVVLLPHGGSLLSGTAGPITRGLKNCLTFLHEKITPQNFVPVSGAVEGIFSAFYQSRIAENDALNKEADSFAQSTQSVQNEVGKQIDQLSQMIREIVTQSIKEMHNSQHQALGSMIRM